MSLLDNLLQDKLAENDRTRAKPSKVHAVTGEREVHFDRDPAFSATWTLSHIRDAGAENLDTASGLQAIEAQIEALKNGDMSQLEAILYSQVLTLNGLFSDCVARGARVRVNGKTATAPQFADDLMHTGLRAQDQCRKTIATIAELRNPKKTTFIKHQQNLAIAQPDNPQQLQETHAETMDIRAARTAESSCLEVEAVAVINGTKDTRRQTKKRSERSQARA